MSEKDKLDKALKDFTDTLAEKEVLSSGLGGAPRSIREHPKSFHYPGKGYCPSCKGICKYYALDLQKSRLNPEDSAEPQSPFPKHCGKCLKSSGKYLRYDLIPFDALKEIVEVLTFGEEKHVETKQGEGQSWREGVLYSQRINKAIRHIVAFILKEDKDKESGRHALAHAIVQLMFLMGMDIRGCKYKKFDDRARLTGGKDGK